MRVLAIGNSFSSDAMRYLSRIAEAEGTEMKTVNLFIGGCPLSRHYANMHSGAAEYDFEFNGERTCIRVSLMQALQSDIWDVVTLQQASSLSVDHNTYQPYLNALAEYVRIHAPKARIYIHQTWAYEEGSKRLCGELGYACRRDMYNELTAAYLKAASELDAPVIPSGRAFEELSEMGVRGLHRDTFHASLGIGRLALGMVWYEALTGRRAVSENIPRLDEPVSENDLRAVRSCAHTAVQAALKGEL